MTSAPFSLKYDATDPSVSVSPSRGPNANGWYTSVLTITSSGTDATSGLDTCTPQTSYSGPDSGTAAFTGTCQDKAGNSASKQLNFEYDGTAPVVSASPSRAANANGWYTSPLTISWSRDRRHFGDRHLRFGFELLRS